MEMSRDGSQFSLSHAILPSLGARSHRQVKLRRFIVSPHDFRYRFLSLYLYILRIFLQGSSRNRCVLNRCWEIFLIFLVVYTAWVSPFEFGFLEGTSGGLAIMDNVVNGFFAVDIVLTFFVAYLDKTTYLLIDDLKKIAWRYTTTWLLLDVISTVPAELARKLMPRKLRSYGFFNMLRLWRLRRVSALFARYPFAPLFIYILDNWPDFLHDIADWRRTGNSTISGSDVQSSSV